MEAIYSWIGYVVVWIVGLIVFWWIADYFLARLVASWVIFYGTTRNKGWSAESSWLKRIKVSLKEGWKIRSSGFFYKTTSVHYTIYHWDWWKSRSHLKEANQ